MNLVFASQQQPPARLAAGAELAVGTPKRLVAGTRLLVEVAPLRRTVRGCHGLQWTELSPPVACPHDPEVEADALRMLSQATGPAVDGLLLRGLERWQAAGAHDTGGCPACQRALRQRLERAHPEQFDPADPLPGDWPSTRRALRWEVSTSLARRLVREARLLLRQHGAEALVAAAFDAVGPLAVSLARHLDAAIVPAYASGDAPLYELFQEPIGQRALIGLAGADWDALRVRHAARLASAMGATLALPEGSRDDAAEALADHRERWRRWRRHFRPTQRLSELLVVYEPACDHHTDGRHGDATRRVLARLAAEGVQYRVVTRLPEGGTEPVLLAEADALPEAEAARLNRRVAEGCSAVVLGSLGAIDAEGRACEPPFEVPAGLGRLGKGTLYGLPLGGDRLGKALDAALGRGRRALSVAGAPLLARCWLEPDRQLDVHLVATEGPDAPPVTDAVLHLSGAAVSGARTALLLSEDGTEQKVALSPWGMGVQARLPAFQGGALLTVDR